MILEQFYTSHAEARKCQRHFLACDSGTVLYKPRRKLENARGISSLCGCATYFRFAIAQNSHKWLPIPWRAELRGLY